MIYIFNPVGGVLYSDISFNRAQITVHELETGNGIKFIITNKNKNYTKFTNTKKLIVFSAIIDKSNWSPTLRSFKDLTSEYPEYIL